MKKQHILLNGNVRSIKEGVDVNTAIANLEAKGHKVQKIKTPPSIKTLERWVSEGGCKAVDGCTCDPDGNCEHGNPSWLLVMGLI